MKKTTILIVEDDAVIANDILICLEDDGYSVAGIAHNSDKALDMLAAKEIDMAILDVQIANGQSGMDVARVIQAKYKIPFIFLTSFSDEKTLTEAQTHSPFGYLVKPFQESTLLTTVKIALSNFEKQQAKFNFSGLEKSLTKKEIAICKLLCNGKSYKEISEMDFISLNTVRFHAKNIYLKLDIKGRSELVTKVLEL